MSSSRERDERAVVLAYKLARSGEFNSWLSIEHELEARGYSRAKFLLDNERTRDEINRLCRESRNAANA